jgi:uncharacterized radical SAM superfamily protein
LGEAEALFGQPWPELQAAAWEVRERCHPAELAFAVPGVKRYDTEHYRNDPHRFVAVSLTGQRCALQCEHCRGRLLAGMRSAPTPDALLALGGHLIERGCSGLLLSGGAEADGCVPLKQHLPAIGRLKERGLRVIVHTGLVDAETAAGLKAAGVDQVLVDIVGDGDTAHEVLHLDRSPADYASTLARLREAGLRVAPHVVIGLHFGQLRGELTALDIIRRVGADVLVLVVLRPLSRTPMAGLPGVSPEEIGRLAATARILNADTPLSLGCARPAGRARPEIERLAVLAGVNTLAFPDPATVSLAGKLGLRTRFYESCCTLDIT